MFSQIKSVAVAAAVSVLALGAFEKAEAATEVSIVLILDGSGSMDSTEFGLQVDAYESLLANIDTDGSISVGVLQFGTTGTPVTGGSATVVINEEFAMTTISSPADRANLVASFTNMTQIGGGTPIGPAIDQAVTMFVGKNCSSTDISCLIDVSTDGISNTPDTTADAVASAAAISAGIDQVNAICVGNNANCDFSDGTDSFSVFASDFTQFRTQLAAKLAREKIIDPVPLPAAGWMLIAGLGGLAAMKRRKKAA